MLNFWATWCPPCVEEMPSLDEFQKRLAASGVVVLGVSVDTSEPPYREFLQKAKVSFLTARDPEAEISAEYGTFKYPGDLRHRLPRNACFRNTSAPACGATRS